MLATFIGSFLFSLVGIIALITGAYGETGRLVLFLVTIGVIILVVVTLLRWIDHLSRLGSVTETTERVEKATARRAETLAARPISAASRCATRKGGTARQLPRYLLPTWAMCST